MPTIFLSPSTQEYNQYVTGAGSEEYFIISSRCWRPVPI